MLRPSIFGDDLFNDFMNDFSFYNAPSLYNRHPNNVMKTDIKETDTSYEVEIDLPGFDKSDVKASLEDGYLAISAVKEVNNDEKDEKSGRYIRRERYTGECRRCYYVGEDITEEDIKAEFKDGILKLSIPKQDTKPHVEKKKYIEIGG